MNRDVDVVLALPGVSLKKEKDMRNMQQYRCRKTYGKRIDNVESFVASEATECPILVAIRRYLPPCLNLLAKVKVVDVRSKGRAFSAVLTPLRLVKRLLALGASFTGVSRTSLREMNRTHVNVSLFAIAIGGKDSKKCA